MNRFKTLLAASSLLAFGMMPAFAQSVPPKSKDLSFRTCFGGYEIVIDFKRDKNGAPFYILDREVIDQKCVATGTSVRLHGMPGIFASETDAIKAYEAYRVLQRYKVTMDDFEKALAYLKSLDEAGKEKVAEQQKQ